MNTNHIATALTKDEHNIDLIVKGLANNGATGETGVVPQKLFSKMVTHFHQ